MHTVGTSEARVTMFDVATRQCHGPRGGPGTRDDNVVDTGIKMGFLARSTRSEKSVRAM